MLIIPAATAVLGDITPMRIMQGVRVLYRRGYHRVRVMPGMSASGMHWRVTITESAGTIDDFADPRI